MILHLLGFWEGVVFLYLVGGNSETACFSSSTSVFPQINYVQVFVSSVLLHFFINVVTSWNACLASETALSCVALILSLLRSALVVQGTWEELWVS